MRYPWNLDYWKSGEWQVVNERLHDMEKAGVRFNPTRSDLFRSLTAVGHPSLVRVVLVGQDPYPQHRYATGQAFSIPPQYLRVDFPPTLREIFAEYERDLGYGIPSNGDLSYWVEQGVLLWNVIPSCEDGKSLSHDWEEYQYLNREIFRILSERGIVFAFLGGVARRYAPAITPNNRVITTSHPSPRGSLNSKMPFNGSRLFTTINGHLTELGLEPIDWRLDGTPSEKDLRRTNLGGGSILPNITGVQIPGLKGHLSPSFANSTFEV
jgi:uracil-DNA glycosylase